MHKYQNTLFKSFELSEIYEIIYGYIHKWTSRVIRLQSIFKLRISFFFFFFLTKLRIVRKGIASKQEKQLYTKIKNHEYGWISTLINTRWVEILVPINDWIIYVPIGPYQLGSGDFQFATCDIQVEGVRGLLEEMTNDNLQIAFFISNFVS